MVEKRVKKDEGPKGKTQITLQLLNQTLDRVDKLAKKERRSRSNMIDYLSPRQRLPASITLSV